MSGFVALFGPRGASPDPRLLERMTKAMAFRAPGGRAVWTGAGVALAMNHLDDAPGAARPQVQSASYGALRIVGQATLTDRGSTLAGLEDAGVRGSPNDLGAILELYRAGGAQALDRLRGEFSFALWDERTRRFACARDPFGVRSLYHARAGDWVLVGNTLEALLEHPVLTGRLDDLALCDFLMFGRAWDLDATAYAEIRRVPPAHVLVGDEEKTRLRRYWTLPDPPAAPSRPAAEVVQGLLEHLEHAVRERAGRAPAAVFMSGGLDSTTVAALARRARRSPDGLLACTFVHDRALPRDASRPMPSEEEGGYAVQVARHLGIEHRVLDLSDEPLYAWWEEGRDLPPEPVDIPQLGGVVTALRDVSRTHRRGLSGEGGDALLRPPARGAGNRRRGRGALAVLGAITRYVARRGRLPGLGLRHRPARSPEEAAPPFPPWFRPELERGLALRDRWNAWLRSLPGHASTQGAGSETIGPRPGARRDLLSPWWPGALWSWDAEVLRAPVELSHPFFDVRLAEYALALAPIPWFWDKFILREATRGVLPEEVRARPKAVDRVAVRHRLILREGGAARRPTEEALAPLGSYLKVPMLRTFLGAPERLLSNEVRLITRPVTLGWWLRHLPRRRSGRVGESR